MKIASPFLNKLGGLLRSAIVRSWMSTLDSKIAYHDRTIDPVFPGSALSENRFMLAGQVHQAVRQLEDFPW